MPGAGARGPGSVGRAAVPAGTSAARQPSQPSAAAAAVVRCLWGFAAGVVSAPLPALGSVFRGLAEAPPRPRLEKSRSRLGFSLPEAAPVRRLVRAPLPPPPAPPPDRRRLSAVCCLARWQPLVRSPEKQ
jgi:hypothetical protein